jgi:hypothetical protein
MNAEKRTWSFSRTGGVDQVVLTSGKDIESLASLDPKLWAVLAMPARQPAVQRALEYLDTDRDGKIRIPDILRTVEELNLEFASLDILFEETDKIEARQLRDPVLRKAATAITERNGKADTEPVAVDLALVGNAMQAFSALPFNGDGIVVPASADAEETSAAPVAAVKDFILSLVAAGYSRADAGGEAGVDAAELERFLADMEAWKVWTKDGEAFDGFASPAQAEKAAAFFSKLAPVIDDYFRRCRVFAMSKNPQASAEIESLIASTLSSNLVADSSHLDRLPLALPEVSGSLHLDHPLHPGFASEVREFFALLRGGETIDIVSPEEWEEFRTVLQRYIAWQARKPTDALQSLAVGFNSDRFGPEPVEAVRALISLDLSMAEEAMALARLEILLNLKRDFLKILLNFVNLNDFYVRKKGLFRSGRLFLDGREMTLCLDVNNPGSHSTMAGLSSMYLVYCDLSRKGLPGHSIVAALTAGDSGAIFPGRNGIFIDSEGRDWDAVVTKLVVQPISMREAFFSPYRWLVKTIEELAMKRAASAEAANTDKLKGVAQTAASAGSPAAKPEQVLPKKMDVGTVAAIGVALGSIGAMVTGILGIFVGMGVWMPLGIVGIFVLVSGPSMILAWMKLRKRNLGPLLNAEGWAINGRLKINVPFGATLSSLAALPPGAARQFEDPFAKKRKPWLLVAVIAVVAACVIAYFAGWLAPLLP